MRLVVDHNIADYITSKNNVARGVDVIARPRRGSIASCEAYAFMISSRCHEDGMAPSESSRVSRRGPNAPKIEK